MICDDCYFYRLEEVTKGLDVPICIKDEWPPLWDDEEEAETCEHYIRRDDDW